MHPLLCLHFPQVLSTLVSRFTRVAPLMLEKANVTNSQAYLSGVYIHVLQWKNLHTAFKLTKAMLLLYNAHTDSRSYKNKS